MKGSCYIACMLFFVSGFSQKVIEYHQFPCKESIVYSQIITNQLIARDKKNDTLFLKIGFAHNCGAELAPSFVQTQDTLLVELKNVSESYTTCDCYFTMDFTVSGINDTIRTLLVNDVLFKPTKSKYVDFPPNEPISKKLLKNKRNKEGKKIGYWVDRSQYGMYTVSYFGDGSNEKNRFFWKKYFLAKTDELYSVSFYFPEYVIIEFSRPQYEKILNEIANEHP